MEQTKNTICDCCEKETRCVVCHYRGEAFYHCFDCVDFEFVEGASYCESCERENVVITEHQCGGWTTFTCAGCGSEQYAPETCEACD